MKPELFRALREHYGIKQVEVAAQIGVSQSALCQFERGRENAVSPWRVLPVADRWLEKYQTEKQA